jgi:hypothetical protein
LAVVARLKQDKQVMVMLGQIQYFQVLRQPAAVLAVLVKAVEIGKTVVMAALVAEAETVAEIVP